MDSLTKAKWVYFAGNIVAFWLMLFTLGILIYGSDAVMEDQGWVLLLGGAILAYVSEKF